jgi:hypothetical protein
MFPLLDEAGDGSGGGSPAAATGTSPAAPAPQAATPPASAASPTPGAAQPPATGGEQGREGWVPSYRLRETREAAIREAQEQWGSKETALQSELNQIRSQLHALVGVQPPQNPEVTGIRSQFGQLYPGLAKLEERAQDLMGLIDRAGDIESQNAHYWQTYGRQTTDRLFTGAEKALGSPLTEEGKRTLHHAFVGFVQSSPELTARYASDPSLVDEYLQVFTSSLIDPVRRGAAASVAGRVTGTAIPQDRGGTVPPVSSGPKPANLDERVAQGWAQYQQSAKP